MDYTSLSPAAVAQLDGLDDWRVILGGVQADYATDGFPAAAELAVAVADAAESANHHPDLDLRHPGRLRITLTTHAVRGLTTSDVELARAISALAREAGASAVPGQAQAFELAIDTMDADRIRPFWAAALGYEEVSGELVDPMRHGPAIWFQQMTEPRTERNRFHVDVVVPHDVAEERVAAAIEAGGRLVSDTRAKAFWVLADAEGNEICVCTWQDRD